MKIYLSGKITGDDNYRPKFDEYENKLKHFGHEVFNPAAFPNMFTWEEFMEIDLKILSLCDAIFLLEDWKESRGARIEKEEAERLGLKILYASNYLYADTLETLCDETIDIFQENPEDEEYDERMILLCSYLKFNIYNFDLLKTDKENFINLCENIPQKDRQFFYTEFIKDANLLFHDKCDVEPSVQGRKLLWKKEKASEEMRSLTESAYYTEEKALA